MGNAGRDSREKGVRLVPGLFRDDVMRARQAEWLGEMRFQAPRFGWPAAAAALLVLVLVAAFLFAGHYTRRERVGGMLRAKEGEVAIHTPQAGIVSRILVSDGQAVTAGQLLVEVSGEIDSAGVGKTREEIDRVLVSKRETINQARSDQASMLANKQVALRRQIALRGREVESLSEQRLLQRSRVSASEDLYQRWLSLKDTGVVSGMQLLERRDLVLQQKAQLQELDRQWLSTRQELDDLESQLATLPDEWRTTDRDLAQQASDVALQISENAAQRAILLRAPSSGIVTNLVVSRSQRVVPDEQLLTIVPRHAELIAELQVPSRSIGFIRNGSRAMLRYDAFPYQKFGAQSGRVTDVGRTAIKAVDAPGSIEATTAAASTYRVLVKPDAQGMLAYGQIQPLRPGMQLEADILLDRRSLFELAFGN